MYVMPKSVSVFSVLLSLGLLLFPQALVAQGSLTPPGAPAPLMKTLDQIEPRMPISSIPKTISQSGSYYLTGNLTGNVAQNGIVIDADHVSLDLNGFRIHGVASSLAGITINSGRKYIEIRNGTISGWGGKALDARNATNSRFSDLTLSGNYDGLYVGTYAIASRIVATSNVTGGITMYLGSLLDSSIIQDNGNSGLVIVGKSVIVRSCSVTGNIKTSPVPATEGGIWVGFDGGNCLIERSTINGNNGDGIQITKGGVEVRDCVISENSNAGFNAAGVRIGRDQATGRCLVTRNTITSNKVGIATLATTIGQAGNLIIGNSFSDNGTTQDIKSGAAFGQFINIRNAGSFVSTDPRANLVY